MSVDMMFARLQDQVIPRDVSEGDICIGLASSGTDVLRDVLGDCLVGDRFVDASSRTMLRDSAFDSSPPHVAEGPSTHVNHVSCTLLQLEANFKVAVSCFQKISEFFRIFQKSSGCPAVVSRDHAVCLAAEHAERQRWPSTTEIGDAAHKGAKSA